mgnify:FL=1|tara:strand:+ start:434 stop:1411 length:978 start_codon:yes stop_codon:yes gene_type:complete
MRNLKDNQSPVVKIQRRTNNLMLITWVINNICTNACDYCPTSLHNGSNHNYEWSNAKQFWQTLLSKYDKLQVAISGGEPTLSPFLLDFCKMIHDAGNKVGITTNLARTSRYMQSLAPYLAYCSASYHPSYEDKDFLEKALSIANITPINLRVMMDGRYWDKGLKFLESCKPHKNITVEAVKVLKWTKRGKGHHYTEEQLKWFKEYTSTTGIEITDELGVKTYFTQKIDDRSDIHFADGEVINSYGREQELINAGKSNFKGWKCNMGLESFFIQWSGKVYLANCMQEGAIGDINKPDQIIWPTSSVICKRNRCHCASDVLITKEKI